MKEKKQNGLEKMILWSIVAIVLFSLIGNVLRTVVAPIVYETINSAYSEHSNEISVQDLADMERELEQLGSELELLGDELGREFEQIEAEISRELESVPEVGR